MNLPSWWSCGQSNLALSPLWPPKKWEVHFFSAMELYMRSDTGNQISHVNIDWPSFQSSHSIYFHKCKVCLISLFFIKNKIVVQSFLASDMHYTYHRTQEWQPIRIFQPPVLFFLVWFYWVRWSELKLVSVIVLGTVTYLNQTATWCCSQFLSRSEEGPFMKIALLLLLT